MKSQRDMFKWLAMAVALAVFLAFALVLPSASAQDEIPPTPTETAIEPTPFPTEELTEIPPETTPQPTEMPTEQGESVQPFSAFASSVPMPPDSDCSDGQCVFWVKARTDDAGLHPACVYSTSYNEIYMGECTNRQGIVSGFRFPNVNIPAGTVIQEAYIEFTVDGPYTDAINVAFYGEASGNANPFSTTSRPSNRPLTAASSLWSIPSTDRWELGELRNSSDLTTIVQGIVNRPDWASGNALAIIVKNAGPASGTYRHRRVIGYDRPVWYPGTENAARLVIKLSTRKPIILLPGGTGSRLYVSQSFDWSQPDGHGGTYTNTYEADKEIWINPVEIARSRSDDYFDVLRLEKDGVTQSTAANYGVNLEARAIVDEVLGTDVYKNLLSDLQNAGYQPGVDLFVFPYDWRMDIAANATLLDSKVQEALEKANGTTDTSQWTIKQVDLLTHSMGASVARQYISDPAHAARVNRLIAIGPAFLGAPKFTKLVLFGDPLLPCVYHENLCLLDPAEVKDIAQNMPGLFEVAPGRAYWTFYDGSPDNLQVFQEDWDFDGDGQVLSALSYDQLKSMLFGLDRDPDLDWDGAGKDINQTVFNMGEAFHDQLDFSWDSSIPVPEIDIIAGTGQCTIGQIQAGYRISFKPPIGGPVQIGPIVRLKYVNGDNTVPLFSTTLYDPARGIDHRGGANVYYVARKFTDHALLLSKDPVRQLVLNLLAGDDNVPDGIISEADVPKRCKGTIINVESPVELHVTDATDNHTGLATLPETGDPVIEQAIPGSIYDEIEETKSVYLPDDGAYTISLKATDSGSFNLILDLYKSDGTVESIVYLRTPLTTTTTGEMTYDTSSTEPPLLYLDHNEDGIYDETITATSVLGPTDSTDTQPPQIQITSPLQGQVLAGGGLMAWQSSDDISGVLNEWGYIDMDTPNALQVTNGEVMTLPPGSHTLTVLAEDRLGNASQEQVSFTVYPFEWLSPISGSGAYTAKAGSTIPVKFSVCALNGVFIPDESVKLNLLDGTGTIIAGPIIFAQNPTQGVVILGSTQYHHNLRTKGLAAGTYTLQITFNSEQMSGIVELPIILR